MAPFYGWGSTASRLDHFEEAVYFLPLSSQKFLALILLTSERWKAESYDSWENEVLFVKIIGARVLN